MTSRAPVAFLAFSILVGALCVRLGFWQLRRLSERRAAVATAEARRMVPALPVLGIQDPEGRRATATGRFDYANEVVLRERAREGVPGVEVVTPLRLDGSDTAVLVVRGFVPSADAMGYNPALHREADSGTVSGLVLPLPSDSAGARPALREGRETWRRLDLTSLRGRSPYPLSPYYLLADSPATALPAPRRSVAPALDDGPHLNYAIQWFAFGLIAFGGAAALWWRGRRPALPVP